MSHVSGKIFHLQNLTEHGKLLNMDVFQALRSMEGQSAFDCIFMDPPYNQDLEKQVLAVSIRTVPLQMKIH